MSSIRHTSTDNENNQRVWGNSDLIALLTSQTGIFLFAYSPKSKSLVSWSDNSELILGVKDVAIAHDANLFLRHVHSDDRFLLLNELDSALKGNSPYRATYRWLRPDNNEVSWLHCRASLVKRDDEMIFEGMIIDLSGEFTGQLNAFAGPDAISTVLAAFPTMVFTLDSDFRILRLNRPTSMFGFKFGDVLFNLDNFKIGRSIIDCFPNPLQKNQIKNILSELLEGKKNYLRSRISQEERVFSLELFPLIEKEIIEGILCVVSDVSEIVSLERELAHLHKTEGLRLLATGVSHNFNNALQSIIGHASIIRNHPKNIQLITESSQSIIETVQRASELSRQLFVQEEPSQSVLVPVDVNLAAMAAANRTEDLFTARIKVSIAFGTPAPVMANQEKLVNAFSAILKNSRESMSIGGTLSIRTYQVYLGSEEIQGLSAGSYAKITISDSGTGMTNHVKERCFDPFFTTKEKDAETGINLSGGGLGLSKAFATAREFNGLLVVETQPGFGTSISMYLPVLNSALIRVENNQPLINNAPYPDILIVDDDLMVLQTAKQILEDANYSCIVAEDSRRALALFTRYKRNLQLVLIDAIMPGIDGPTLIRRIKRINQEIKIIGFSGAPTATTDLLLEAGALQVIRKPVIPEVLKKIVRELLGNQAAA